MSDETLRRLARQVMTADARGDVVMRDQLRVAWAEAGAHTTMIGGSPVYRCADGSHTRDAWKALEGWAREGGSND
jgi:hypothetical protein